MDIVSEIRDFNRFYTRRIGLVGRNYVDSDLSLSALRVLYELGQADPPTARQLARELALDEGYLSRILSGFTARNWLEKHPDPKDRRIMILTLSKAGRAIFEDVVSQACARTTDMIADLDSFDQNRVARAMQEVRELLGGQGAIKPSSGAIIRNLEPGDSGWLIQQHAELYQQDEGFDATFEALVADILAGYIRSHDPTCERAFIAERGGQRLGSVFCVRGGPVTAKLRLFLLLPQARGLGLGKRLLSECMRFAKSVGYQEMRLWTHESHRAACALYHSFGWQLIDSKQVHSFGVDLVEQSWRIDL